MQDKRKPADWLYSLEIGDPLPRNGPGCLGYPEPRDEPPRELVDYDELIESEFDEVQKAAWQAAIEEIDLLKDRLADLLNERDELRGQVESLIAENDRLRARILEVEQRTTTLETQQKMTAHQVGVFRTRPT